MDLKLNIYTGMNLVHDFTDVSVNPVHCRKLCVKINKTKRGIL